MNKTANSVIFILSALILGWLIAVVIMAGGGRIWGLLFSASGIPLIPAIIIALVAVYLIMKYELSPHKLMLGNNAQKKVFNKTKSAQKGLFTICVLLTCMVTFLLHVF